MYNEDLQELYHVTWRPQGLNVHLLDDPLHNIPNPHSSALAYLGTVKTPSKPAGAYRPPGARGQVTPLAFKREDEGGTAYVSNGSFALGTSVNGFGMPGLHQQHRPALVGARTDVTARATSETDLGEARIYDLGLNSVNASSDKTAHKLVHQRCLP